MSSLSVNVGAQRQRRANLIGLRSSGFYLLWDAAVVVVWVLLIWCLGSMLVAAVAAMPRVAGPNPPAGWRAKRELKLSILFCVLGVCLLVASLSDVVSGGRLPMGWLVLLVPATLLGGAGVASLVLYRRRLKQLGARKGTVRDD